jgi:hypothetical protein
MNRHGYPRVANLEGGVTLWKAYGLPIESKIAACGCVCNSGKLTFGEQYGIENIPTQVFLDENGKEYSRHVGFFAEDDLIKVLKTKGVK